MKELPILFSGPMVKRILEDRKWQTRRIMKPQPQTYGGVPIFTSDKITVNQLGTEFEHPTKPTCPYGQPGDRLWVRETFKIKDFWGGSFSNTENGFETESEAFCTVVYQDGTEKKVEGLVDNGFPNGEIDEIELAERYSLKKGWSPGIFMPRWARRIDLEIVEIRVERLQDISEEDAIAEGILKNEFGYFWEGMEMGSPKDVFSSPKYAFANLINFVNDGPRWNMPGKPPPTWRLNPWVWVVEFKRVRK